MRFRIASPWLTILISRAVIGVAQATAFLTLAISTVFATETLIVCLAPDVSNTNPSLRFADLPRFASAFTASVCTEAVAIVGIDPTVLIIIATFIIHTSADERSLILDCDPRIGIGLRH